MIFVDSNNFDFERCDACGGYEKSYDMVDLYDPDNNRYYRICKSCAKYPNTSIAITRINILIHQISEILEELKHKYNMPPKSVEKIDLVIKSITKGLPKPVD